MHNFAVNWKISVYRRKFSGTFRPLRVFNYLALRRCRSHVNAMKKTFIILAVLFVASVARAQVSGGASADVVKKIEARLRLFDTNGNGVIEQDEADKGGAATYMQIRCFGPAGKDPHYPISINDLLQMAGGGSGSRVHHRNADGPATRQRGCGNRCDFQFTNSSGQPYNHRWHNYGSTPRPFTKPGRLVGAYLDGFVADNSHPPVGPTGNREGTPAIQGTSRLVPSRRWTRPGKSPWPSTPILGPKLPLRISKNTT